MISEPGQYAGVPIAEYLEIPAVSAGLLHTVVSECPQAAWFQSWLNPEREREDTKASDAGSIAHEILLCGTQDCVQVFEPSKYPNAKGGGCATGWTNNAIRDARDECRAAGKIPVLAPEFLTIRNMVDSARRFIDSLRHTEPAIWTAFQPDAGESEQTLVWDDDGLLCRMRPDRISLDRKIIIDPKFSGVSVEPGEWSRKQMTPMGYWVTAAWYRRGCRVMFGTEPDYIFLVIGQKAPHLCSLVGVDPAGFEHGGMKVERGLRTWLDCVERGWFPGYANRVCYPELKPWELAAEMDRSGLDEDGIPYDYETLTGRKAA